MKDKKTLFSTICAVILAVLGLTFSPQTTLTAKADYDPDFTVFTYAVSRSADFTLDDENEHPFICVIRNYYDDIIDTSDYSIKYNWKVKGEYRDCFKITRTDDETGYAYVTISQYAKSILGTEFYVTAELSLTAIIDGESYDTCNPITLTLHNDYKFSLTPGKVSFEKPGDSRTFTLSTPDNLTGCSYQWRIPSFPSFVLEGSLTGTTVNINVLENINDYIKIKYDDNIPEYIYDELYCDITSASGKTMITVRAFLYYYCAGLAQNLSVNINSNGRRDFIADEKSSCTFTANLSMPDLELDDNALVWSFGPGDDKFFEFENGINKGKNVTVKLKSTAADAMGSNAAHTGKVILTCTLDGHSYTAEESLYLTAHRYKITPNPTDLDFDGSKHSSHSIKLSNPEYLQYSDLTLSFSDGYPNKVEPSELFTAQINGDTIIVNAKSDAAAKLQSKGIDNYYCTLVISYKNAVELQYVTLRFYPNDEIYDVTYTPDNLVFYYGISSEKKIKANINLPQGSSVKYKWSLGYDNTAMSAFSLKESDTDTVTVIYNGKKISTLDTYYVYLEVRSGINELVVSPYYLTMTLSKDESSQNDDNNPKDPKDDISEENKPTTPTSDIAVAVNSDNDTIFTENGFSYGVISQDAKTVALTAPVDKALKKYTVPSTVTHKNITYSVTEIGDSAFNGCKRATSIKLPNTISKIGSSAFSGLGKLKSFTIPKNVEEIGAKAFFKCSKLGKVTVNSSVLKKVGSKAFGKTKKGIQFKCKKKYRETYKKYLKKSGAKGAKYN